jgi:hypothetical protein
VIFSGEDMETSSDEKLLSDTIEVKIEVFILTQKKRLLLEELYRHFFEGEKEPKKRKRREVKQDEVTSSGLDRTEAAGSVSNSLVSKKRKKRGSLTPAPTTAKEAPI